MIDHEDPSSMQRLAELILANQDDLGELYAKPQKYWDELAQKQKVEREDAILLALSPLNQARFRFAEHKERQRFYSEVANLDNQPRKKAAAGGVGSSTSFEPMESFELKIEPSGRTGWLILLAVKAVGRFPRGCILSLKDEDGRLWVSGEPDSDGWIMQEWGYDGDPRRYEGRLSILVDGTPVTSEEFQAGQ